MNRERILDAIRILEMGETNLDMDVWQDTENGVKTTLQELHRCGTAACLAGHVAVSPMFKEAGGSNDNGSPWFNGSAGEYAIAEYFEISLEMAEMICCVEEGDEDFYGVEDVSNITKYMVIDKLKGLLGE